MEEDTRASQSLPQASNFGYIFTLTRPLERPGVVGPEFSWEASLKEQMDKDYHFEAGKRLIPFFFFKNSFY